MRCDARVAGRLLLSALLLLWQKVLKRETAISPRWKFDFAHRRLRSRRS